MERTLAALTVPDFELHTFFRLLPRRFISRVIWSGFETNAEVVHGLWGRSLESHLDQIKALGFNCIRLPFAGDICCPQRIPKA